MAILESLPLCPGLSPKQPLFPALGLMTPSKRLHHQIKTTSKAPNASEMKTLHFRLRVRVRAVPSLGSARDCLHTANCY